MQIVSRNDCVEAENPSLARRTRFRLLAQRGIGRKYGFTVDALCGSPLCIREEHVVYRPWKALTKPTKWGEYAKKLAALKVGQSFQIPDCPHSQPEISKLRGGIGASRLARYVIFTVRRLSGSTGVRITKIGTWDIREDGRTKP
jgi:hypothetical protein